MRTDLLNVTLDRTSFTLLFKGDSKKIFNSCILRPQLTEDQKLNTFLVRARATVQNDFYSKQYDSRLAQWLLDN